MVTQAQSNEMQIKQLLQRLTELHQLLLQLLEKEGGYSFYSNEDVGVSFDIPSGYSIDSESDNTIVLKNRASDKITIDAFTPTKNQLNRPLVTDTDAKFGEVTYFYSEEEWLKSGYISNRTGGVFPTAPIKPSLYTADNLPVVTGTTRWLTYFILPLDPLISDTTYKLNITGTGNTTALNSLVKTFRIINSEENKINIKTRYSLDSFDGDYKIYTLHLTGGTKDKGVYRWRLNFDCPTRHIPEVIVKVVGDICETNEDYVFGSNNNRGDTRIPLRILYPENVDSAPLEIDIEAVNEDGDRLDKIKFTLPVSKG